MLYERRTSQPENPFSKLVSQQTIAIVPEFTLESGHKLYQVPVAYKTWGKLNDAGDNVMIICHALSGSCDVEDWWGPLMGPGRAFDPTKFFIICCNVLGSPYGTASPVTIDPVTGVTYGPEFPLATIRDDVTLHKLILDDLGVKQVAICIGGSMGGMQVLEWSFFGPDYVRAIVPIATSAKHSAWCISWGEAQRQSIYSDPNYKDGYYTPDAPPSVGLGAARMAALLTYRSRNSFESRFGRKVMDKPTYSSAKEPETPAEEHHQIHNDGHRHTKGPMPRSSSADSTSSLLAASSKALELAQQQQQQQQITEDGVTVEAASSGQKTLLSDPLASSTTTTIATGPAAVSAMTAATTATSDSTSAASAAADGHTTLSPSSPPSSPPANGGLVSSSTTIPVSNGATPISIPIEKRLRTSRPTVFSAQNYLRYQGDKFIHRFDANCYIAITRKMDVHDVSTGRSGGVAEGGVGGSVYDVLESIVQPALVIGVESDGLFTISEQYELAEHLHAAEMVVIQSPDGHDGFLLEFEQINHAILSFMHKHRHLVDILSREGFVAPAAVGEVVKESLFGESEIVNW
ncbi:homoserine O- acetyltransferase [Actinomortierella ambigua]|uniref:Homoserine O- acetyltransferase n=1 Tax=Actinomortierella ambigua TaxID=1343610 RepID=A0A9P6TWI7_9FUNG|nr:homoserine O- acetyltransferase [Actinomortierella ambigua]